MAKTSLRRLSVRSAAAASLLAVAALTMSACGSSASPSSDASAAASAETSSLQLVSQATKNATSAAFTMSVDAAGQVITAEGKAAYDPLQLELTMNASGMSVEERLIGDTFYLKLPSQPKWIKTTAAELSAQSGVNLDQLLQQSNQANPEQVLDMLAVATNVTTSTDTIDGASFTKYTGTLDVSSAVGSLSDDAKKQAELMLNEQGVKTIDFEVWVGSDNMPRRIVESMKTNQGDVTITLNFTDYNQPVTVTAPPASDTVSMSELKAG